MVKESSATDFNDITEHNYLEKTLIKATEKAKVGNKAKSMLEDKNHEIRTYMTRIISMTDLTLMTELTEEQQEYLKIVKSSTKLLLKLLNDILDHSKLLTSDIDLEQAPFDIRETIYEVIDMFHVAAKQKNIELRLSSLDQIIPQKITGDSKRLKQVLSNLIGNSLRFTDHGEVTLNVDLEQINECKVRLKFTVSDTGRGIPEDTLIKLFEKSSREDNSHIKEFGGKRLTISKRLVELMEGNIYVDSKEGVGSKFFFTASFSIQDKGGSLSSKQQS